MKHRADQLYVITAISRLTGEGEVVSLPMSKISAIAAAKKDIRANALAMDRAYIDYRIEEYPQQQLILPL